MARFKHNICPSEVSHERSSGRTENQTLSHIRNKNNDGHTVVTWWRVNSHHALIDRRGVVAQSLSMRTQVVQAQLVEKRGVQRKAIF